MDEYLRNDGGTKPQARCRFRTSVGDKVQLGLQQVEWQIEDQGGLVEYVFLIRVAESRRSETKGDRDRCFALSGAKFQNALENICLNRNGLQKTLQVKCRKMI